MYGYGPAYSATRLRDERGHAAETGEIEAPPACPRAQSVIRFVNQLPKLRNAECCFAV